MKEETKLRFNVYKKTLLVLFILLCISCSKDNKEDIRRLKQVDSLSTVIYHLKNNIKKVNSDTSYVQRLHLFSTNYMMIHFKPIGLKMKLSSKKPIFNETTFLSVPASFTSPNTKIEGLFIENGNLVNNTINNEINGFVMFNGNECIIDKLEYLTKEIIAKAEKEKYNIFQQVLLVKNS